MIEELGGSLQNKIVAGSARDTPAATPRKDLDADKVYRNTQTPTSTPGRQVLGEGQKDGRLLDLDGWHIRAGIRKDQGSRKGLITRLCSPGELVLTYRRMA